MFAGQIMQDTMHNTRMGKNSEFKFENHCSIQTTFFKLVFERKNSKFQFEHHCSIRTTFSSDHVECPNLTNLTCKSTFSELDSRTSGEN